MCFDSIWFFLSKFDVLTVCFWFTPKLFHCVSFSLSDHAARQLTYISVTGWLVHKLNP